MTFRNLGKRSKNQENINMLGIPNDINATYSYKCSKFCVNFPPAPHWKVVASVLSLRPGSIVDDENVSTMLVEICQSHQSPYIKPELLWRNTNQNVLTEKMQNCNKTRSFSHRWGRNWNGPGILYLNFSAVYNYRILQLHPISEQLLKYCGTVLFSIEEMH